MKRLGGLYDGTALKISLTTADGSLIGSQSGLLVVGEAMLTQLVLSGECVVTLSIRYPDNRLCLL